ncbi:MAG: hydantoinase/oxoprolinase family protein [Phenylobacterium sp.]|uniref:hydantoinase/oxoprolinase family protein n=1 Tax=Phenylobacterium sp. TaxID=1871053 RepID=UPI0025E59998|nr:hydantoinase/oxoprolinase family protein [Phenylobacterium sp.]MBI1197980.1 hydantoinase/oxoprolinase family protein [Phenylobacterium sp.]
MTYSLAIDIGGTFTDAVLRRDDGALVVDKTLTTHQNLLEGFFRGVDLVLGKAGVSPADVNGVVVHATTVVTNALIERKGAPTALIITKGFGDVLSIRNEHRYDMYDPQIEFADTLIPRELTFEVDERILADGEVLKPVDPAEIRKLAAEMKDKGVVSAAICLINGFRNGANEQAIAEVLRAEAPDMYLSLSSTVAPQIREYPRASTTAINAYTAPITEPYLRGLKSGLEEAGVANRPLIMLSSGGVIGAEVAGRNPVRMIESGPAAGALAAAYYAERLGLDRLMSFDMGGTTAKACLIEDRKPLVAGSFEVDRMYRFAEGSGMPLTIPSIDMIEIGAGGGSIASVDNLGLLKVGPRSAGSEPGPACYGRGGTDPTVTDADLVLGLLDADNFLGGEMPLDKAAAEAAVDRIAERLGATREQTAAGVFRIVAETMAGAARAHATDRGVDHRGLPLLAFGGAGPVHACAVGELLQSTAVIFPPQASVLSAFGSLVTPVRLDLVRSALGRLDSLDWAEVDRLIGEMVDEARLALAEAGTAAKDIRLTVGADLRYAGQQNEVGIVFDADPREARDAAAIGKAFEAAYFAQYGVNPSHVPMEVVSWRLTARGRDNVVDTVPAEGGAPAAPKGERTIPLWPGAPKAKLYDRPSLAPGQSIAGPALVEERETTIVIPPGWTGTVDAIGCITAKRSV